MVLLDFGHDQKIFVAGKRLSLLGVLAYLHTERSFAVANYQCRKNNLTWGIHHCI